MKNIRIMKVAVLAIVGLLTMTAIGQADEMTISISSVNTISKDATSSMTRGALAVAEIPKGDSIYIDYAELIIPVSADVDENDPLLLHVMPIANEWTPGQLDWQGSFNDEGADSTIQFDGILPLGQSTDGKEIRIDVTAMVKAWKAGKIPNYGILIKSASETKSTFSPIKDGRYNGEDAKLRIVYCKP